MELNILLLSCMALAAIWTVMASTLIRSVIGLALTSVILSTVLFRLGASLAAMFELSVCAGLITAVFISAISMIQPLTFEEIKANYKFRVKRYRYMLVLMIAAGVALLYFTVPADFVGVFAPVENDVRIVLWKIRQLDLIGQVAIIIAGIFAVKILYSELKKVENPKP